MQWSAEDKLEEVLRAPIGAHVPAPDVRVIERSGWYQVARPGPIDQSTNEVIVSELDATEAEKVIDETIAFYRKLGVRFKWVVGPKTRPADMAERLRRRGFEAWGARGMCAGPELEIAAPPDVTVDEVGAEAVDEYANVMAAGWQADRALTRADVAVAQRSGRHIAFVARRADRAIGGAGYVRHARSAYFVAAVVLAEARGSGAYRALLAARMRHAFSRGLGLVTTHAREATSAPMLEHLGFETVCHFMIFRSAAP